MTEQSPDYVHFKGYRYVLWDDSSRRLPMLNELGLHANLESTATIRRYEAEYEIDNDQLYLTKLNVGEAERESQFPPIGGVFPIKVSRWEIDDDPDEGDKDLSFYEFVYDLKHPLTINGVITLNSAEWEDLLTAPSPEILRVQLKNGQVKAVEDVSSKYQALKHTIDLIEQDKNSQLGQMPIAEWVSYRSDEIREQYKQFFAVKDEDASS